jgi:hypothetical protein
MFWLMLAIFSVLAIWIASTIIFWTARLVMFAFRFLRDKLFPPKLYEWQSDVRPVDWREVDYPVIESKPPPDPPAKQPEPWRPWAGF